MIPANIEILYSAEKISKRITELGKEISSDYQGKKLTAVVLMTGGMIFAADLVRNLDIPVWVD
ncbi:MAG: hypoxanthine phosphoribosyltransferase, partial [Lentisphaeria bacterium]|nr:hypoxanthine phosphoribosyltransferase [Lentisphaeria bacterium]